MSDKSVRSEFLSLLQQRILVLDGAMGTMIQALKLNEEGYRGARFDASARPIASSAMGSLLSWNQAHDTNANPLPLEKAL